MQSHPGKGYSELAAPQPIQASDRDVSQAAIVLLDGSESIVIPTDVFSGVIPQTLNKTTQEGADLLAWQDFLALNQPVDAGEHVPSLVLGAPGRDALGTFQTVVWETFADTSALFMPDAGVSAGCQPSDGGSLRSLPEFTPANALQPVGDNKWLADTASKLVWYQVKVNEVEANYITEGGLADARKQWDLSVDAGVIPPPGSITLKAAWRQLTEPNQYGRYLVMDACVPQPGGGTQLVQLGLVGFHIMHKLSNQQQWLWATFEQIDNAPEQVDAGAPSDAGFSFFTPQCTPRPISPKCLPPTGGKTSCEANALRVYSLDRYFNGTAAECGPYPTQVVRETPIPNSQDNPVRQLNAEIQKEIAEKYPQSVFQYYQLINVMWWSSSFDDPGSSPQRRGGVPIPLKSDGLQPNPGASVANTTLETYEQNTQNKNCLSCHVNASISTVADKGKCGTEACAADFTFIFQNAQLPMSTDAGH
jgi:hypothetical protein